MFLFAPISFRFDSKMDIIRSIIAFAIFDELKEMNLPMHREYNSFRPNMAPYLDYLVQLIKQYRIPPSEDDRDTLQQFLNSKALRKLREEKKRHEQKSDEDCRRLAQALLDQWPDPQPQVHGLDGNVLLDVDRALEALRPEWERLFRNMELSKHLETVQSVLNRRYCDDQYRTPTFIYSSESFPERIRGGEIPNLTDDLMRQPGPDNFLPVPDFDLSPCPAQSVRLGPLAPEADGGGSSHDVGGPRTTIATATSYDELDTIITEFMKSTSSVRRRYGEDLRQGLMALKAKDHDGQDSALVSFRTLDTSKYIREVQRCLSLIRKAMSNPQSSATGISSIRYSWLQYGSLWPADTPVTLLEQLRSTKRCAFGPDMKNSILHLGLAITRLQRVRRLNDLALRNDHTRYREELLNTGHVNWQPEERPDWLLLEIESNILIRPSQVDVALATVNPGSGTNSVLQMNMGQGK